MNEKYPNRDQAVSSMLASRKNYEFAEISNKRLAWPEDLPPELEDALVFFWNAKKILFEQAYLMQEQAIVNDQNYRYFGVGAAAVVWRASDNSFKIITGYNEKERDQPKHCAEMKILEQAKHERYDKIVGLVVVGQHQADKSRLACTTLHPCRECRNKLAHNSNNTSSRPGNPLTWAGMPVVNISIPPNNSGADIDEPYTLLEEQYTLDQLLFEHDNALQKLGETSEDRY